MIFVTVGTQLPFDRMIRTIDEWAAKAGRSDVFAQIGPASYRPTHIAFAAFIPADECRQKSQTASVIIAHAGMGSIITALELAKPIIVMPRRSELAEHRNNHQVSTALKFKERGSVLVAMDEHELLKQLDNIDNIQGNGKCEKHASPQLLGAIRDFVNAGRLPDVASNRRGPDALSTQLKPAAGQA